MKHDAEQVLNFRHKEAFERFVCQLQQLFFNAIILVTDQQKEIIYENKLSKLNTSLMNKIKQHLLFKQPDCADPIFINDAGQQYTFHYHRAIVEVKAPLFSGRLHILFSTQKNVEANVISPASAVFTLPERFNSRSPKMQHMFSIIERVAITEFPVLVRGESGSGKELVARAIHDYSQRRDKGFIVVNCAALNASILESELFGHVKGAFTGAIRDHKGVFERAKGGTLFLDEIAEIPLELQAKLLRALETGEFIQLGGEKVIQADVRIIAATHRALREEAKSGRFRQDLLYRLRVIPIFIPPLRERKMDIPLITEKILEENNHKVTTAPTRFSDEAMQILCSYDWPGNVRELKNTLLYALTMANGKNCIDTDDLPDELMQINTVFSKGHTSEAETGDLCCLSEAVIRSALHKNHNNINRTAKMLGISRTTLWRCRKKFNL